MRRLAPTLFLAVMVVYFAYHALAGEQGLISWLGYQRKIESLREEATYLEAERDRLARHERLLSSDSLDLDFLEERARALLFLEDPDDVVVRLEDEVKLEPPQE